MSKIIEKKPRVALLESIRSIGYDFNSALADIVDNSISANAKKVEINLIQSIPAIVIIDDGCGMNQDELSLAMDLGSKDPNDDRALTDLGRFGLGLKSASFSQCQKLTVTSYKDLSLNSMTWDLKLVRTKQEWFITSNSEEEALNLPYVPSLLDKKHGTIVQWSDFDRIKLSNNDLESKLLENLREASTYLSLVFHKFISSNKIHITINGNELNHIDPFLTHRTDTQKLKPDTIRITNNKGEDCFVEVKPYILPFINNLSPEDKKIMGGMENIRNKQGFYIYRNERLITWGSWLHLVGINELYKNARVEVNIPNNLDDVWEVDVKKSSATIPGVIRKSLFPMVKKAINGSQNIYKKRSENTSEKLGYTVIWNISEERDSYEVTINKSHPMISQFFSTLSNNQSTLFEIIINDLEENLPKMKLFTNIAESKNEIKPNHDNEETIRSIINSLENVTNEEIKFFLESLFQSEPYCEHIDLLEKLKGEYK